MLAAFRVRSFRFQWPADLLTSWAFEMETLILGWYVMVGTGSVLLLTAFASLQYLGTLAAPMFGVLGDRLGSRAMLCGMRAIYTALAALLLTLAATGWLSPTWVLVVAGLAGVVRPNDMVMRHSLIGETIPAGHVMGALGLSRASMDSARVAGALAGAGLSAFLGVAPAYVVVTLFYVASLTLTLRVGRGRAIPDVTAAAGPAPPRPSRYRDLRDGLAHVRHTPTLLGVMCVAFLVNLCAYPVTSGLLPYVARRVYLVDATGLGWLVASFSFGALLGSIAIVLTGGPRHFERSMLVSAALWYALLVAFAQARTLGAGVALLLVAGFVQSIAMISMMGSVLAVAGDRFRSRVMGVRTLAVYGLPLGLMGAGALIERIGYAATISAGSAVGLVLTLLIARRWRAVMWRRRPAVSVAAMALGAGVLLASCAP